MPKRSTTTKASADLPWTSTRCLRLLRPLMTRFHALRVYHEEVDSSRAKRSAASSGPLKRKERYGKAEDSQDTEWGLFQPRKRAKKTYSARPALNEARNNYNLQERPCAIEHTTTSLLGTLSVPTPYLNKTLARPQSVKKERLSTGPVDDMTKIPLPSIHAAQQGPRLDGLTQQLYTDFKKVLDYTVREDEDLHEERNQTGAPSLFSMCVRNVPIYIANEEEWQKEDDDEDQINVTADTYNRLEDFGQGQERGWRHLRSVVLAHAIHIVKNAIEAGYIDDDISVFSSLCWKSGLMREGWSFLESVAQTRRHTFPALTHGTPASYSWAQAACFRTSSTANRTQPGRYHDPHTLLNCVGLSSSQLCGLSFARARISRMLLGAGQLASEWLSCPCYGMIWQDVIKSLSKEDENSYQALGFIHEYLLRSSGIPSQQGPHSTNTTLPVYRSPAILEASTRTLSSLCAMLATIALVDIAANQHASLTYVRGPLRVIRLAAIEIQQANLDDIENLDEQLILARILILLTDMIIAAGPSVLFDLTRTSSRLRMIYQLNEVLTSRENSESKGIEHLSRQLCDTSKCYARATSQPDLNVVESFLDKLIKSETGHRRYSRFVTRLALDTAIVFAQENPSAAAESYVHTLEMSISRFAKPKQPVLNTVIQSSPATIARPGFRWEQGVCEWVASTPASLLKLKKTMSLDLDYNSKEAPQTPCTNAFERWTAPSQVFVGVVVPSAAACSSPTKSGHDDDTTYDTPPRIVKEDKRPPFEDSGIFMDPEDEGAAVYTVLTSPKLAESCDVPAGGVLAIEESASKNISPAQPGHTSLQPSSSSQGRAALRHNLRANTRHPTRKTSSSQRSLSRIKPQPGQPRPSLRSKEPISSKIQLLRDDESEDELSINESDCCAGAFESTPDHSSSESSSSLLGVTIVLSSRSGTHARRAGGTLRVVK